MGIPVLVMSVTWFWALVGLLTSSALSVTMRLALWVSSDLGDFVLVGGTALKGGPLHVVNHDFTRVA